MGQLVLYGRASPRLGGLICLTTSKSRCQPGLFSNEEAEAQRDEVTDPQSHSWATEELADRVYLRFTLPPPYQKRCPETWCEDSPPPPGFILSEAPSPREQQAGHLPKGRGHAQENRPSGRHWAPARPARGHRQGAGAVWPPPGRY